MNLISFKKDILEESIALLSEKANLLKMEIATIQEAANDETKSSAGDKYETGREMMMQERGKLMDQLNQIAKQLVLLNGINPEQSSKKVTLGSLVKTKQGYYFLAVAVGQMKTWKDAFTISTVAPIAQAMLDKEQGDSFTFNKIESKILELV